MKNFIDYNFEFKKNVFIFVFSIICSSSLWRMRLHVFRLNALLTY